MDCINIGERSKSSIYLWISKCSGTLHSASTKSLISSKLFRFAAWKNIGFLCLLENLHTNFMKPVDMILVPYPMSWVDEELMWYKFIGWVTHILQQEALENQRWVNASHVWNCAGNSSKTGIICKTVIISIIWIRKHPGKDNFSPYDNPKRGLHQLYECLSRFSFARQCSVPRKSWKMRELNPLITQIKSGEEIWKNLQKEFG